MVAGLFKTPLISIPEVHAAGGNSSLIGSLETIVNSVNYTSDIDAIYQGMIVGETTLQQLINAYNALPTESFSGSDCNSLQIASEVLYWTPILAKLGYTNETTIEWALNSQAMMSDGLPYCYNDGSSKAFLVYDRYLILGYGYAIQYNYELSKWNLTQAYDSFKAAVTASTYPALLWIDQDGAPYTISYGPRYYDECGETINAFLDFYNLGITSALNDAVTTWLWTNNNLWSGTHYNYALNWKGYECEAGGFLQVALLLWHEDPSLADVNNPLADIENRFLQEQWLSPQWTPMLGGPSSYVVVHMASGNPQLRLENTVMAWAAILGSYGELNSIYQSDVQSMLAGASPAWLELLQSPLCGSNFPYFSEHSDSGTSNDATATGADLLFMLGIVPQTAVLAVPLEENLYEYIYNILDPDLFNINLTTNVVTVSLATAGTLNFQFNQTVTGSFSTSGIYTVQFSSNWNTILSITFVSTLPSNRQYMYTTPPSYYITSSVDSNSIISPSGNVMVNASFAQTFTYSAKSGYIIACVLVDGFPVPITGSYTFNNVQANHTISVTSAVNPTITAFAGANGVISPSGSVSVDYGDSQDFSITPDSDYYIASIMIDGGPVTVISPSGQTVNFTNVEASHTLTATFSVDTFTVTASAGANGAISPTGSVSVNYGGSQTFTITPNAGYHITSITANGAPVTVTSPSGQTYQFSAVSADSSLTATFAINTYTITVTQTANGVIAPGTSTVNYGATSSFSITPATGYYITSITVNGSSVAVTSSSGQTVSFTDVQATHTITASFAIDTFNIIASAANGAISPIGSVSVNYGGSQSFTITASAGYHIADVVVDGVSQGAVSSYTFTNVQADHTITASFAINTFNITASAGAGGSISPSESISVNYGDNQTFKITANTGYYIVDVTVNGSSVGAVSSYTFTNVQAAYTISATFALTPTIYGIAVAVAIVAIVAVVLVLRKSKKSKSQGPQ